MDTAPPSSGRPGTVTLLRRRAIDAFACCGGERVPMRTLVQLSTSAEHRCGCLLRRRRRLRATLKIDGTLVP